MNNMNFQNNQPTEDRIDKMRLINENILFLERMKIEVENIMDEEITQNSEEFIGTFMLNIKDTISRKIIEKIEALDCSYEHID